MGGPPVDLSVLARGTTVADTGKADTVPMPKSRWKTRILLPGTVLIAFGSLLGYSARDALYPATEVRVAPAVAKTAAGATGSMTFQAAGWVEPDPYPTYVPALIDGIIKDVMVLEGQEVKGGQIVATLVDEDAKLALQRAEAEVRQRAAALEIQKASRDAAQREWDNPIDRARMVAVSESQVTESKAGIAQLEAEILAETGRVEELSEQLKREEKASEVSAIPEWQKLQTGLRLKTQKAVLESFKAKRAELEAKLRQQEAEQLAAKENLRLRIPETKALQEAKSSLLEAQAAYENSQVALNEAKLRLERTQIRAPLDGIVMQRLKQPGDSLMTNSVLPNSSQILRIYNPKKLQVRVDVPLADASHLCIGQDARVVVEVLRDVTFNGAVTRIVHEADIQKNTLQVKVAIENPLPALKPEMLARVQFIAPLAPAAGDTSPRQRVFVPENAMQRNGAQATVWIVDKGRNVATKRSITVGEMRTEGHIEVTQGLQPGDAVITGDTSGLKEGQKVKITGETSGGEAHGTH